MPLTVDEFEQCLRVLEAVAKDRGQLLEVDIETRNRLLTAAGRVSRPERHEQRLLSRAARRKNRRELRAHDEALLERAEIRQKRLDPVFVTPDPAQLLGAAGGHHGLAGDVARLVSETSEPESQAAADAEPELRTPRACYVCKARMTRFHRFYDQMCGACGDFNYEKRTQSADLHGRTALISGARVKIG